MEDKVDETERELELELEMIEELVLDEEGV